MNFKNAPVHLFVRTCLLLILLHNKEYRSIPFEDNDDRVSDIDLLVIAPVKKNLSGDLSAIILSLFNPAQWSKLAASNRAFYLDIITEGIILYGTRPVVG
jgi:hypothetical protein